MLVFCIFISSYYKYVNIFCRVWAYSRYVLVLLSGFYRICTSYLFKREWGISNQLFKTEYVNMLKLFVHVNIASLVI